MPAEYQQKLVNTIEGLEEARVVQPGMSTPATNTMYIYTRTIVYIITTYVQRYHRTLIFYDVLRL